MRPLAAMLLALAGLLGTGQAPAFDPITSVLGKGITTAMDVRSKDEVLRDVEIDSSLTKKLLTHQGDEFAHISALVFARQVVLVGFARTPEARQRAEQIARGDKRIRSLTNDILLGRAGGDMARNTLLDKKIELALAATPGVASVNLRWKVHGGDVFLMGVVRGKAEADRAVKKIKSLDGVQQVHPRLRTSKKG